MSLESDAIAPLRRPGFTLNLHRYFELWAALGVIILVTLLYVWGMWLLETVPRSSGLFGHGLGVIGFGLMVLTEILYSLRKRSRQARWGRMVSWLQFHIFTGLVGPYLVLLHTAWQFNGVAGMTTLLTVVIVMSGFIGRYIYTAVPRTADGAELAAADLEREIATCEAAVQSWLVSHPAPAEGLPPDLRRLVDPSGPTGTGWSLVLGRTLAEWRYRRQWQQEKGRLAAMGYTKLYELEEMLRRRRIIRRQINSLALTRQMLATWHAIHVPLGLSLFTLAFIHIGAALYYATLLK